MRKQLISLLFILLVVSLGTVAAENNTTITAIESGDSNISFKDGYKGYCAEWGEHSAEEGQKFYVQDSSKINNSNYLKTMFLFFYNQTQKDIYATQHMVWKFTDEKQFSRFNQSWYNQIIDVGNKYVIPDSGKIPINQTHYFSFDFKAFTPFIDEYQNFFAYQFLIKQIINNSTIQISNSTINNSSVLLPNYQNNNGYIQYDGVYNIDSIKDVDIPTSNTTLNAKKTGIWILGCIIIMLTIIWVANKRP